VILYRFTEIDIRIYFSDQTAVCNGSLELEENALGDKEKLAKEIVAFSDVIHH